jgi:aminopeptidase
MPDYLAIAQRIIGESARVQPGDCVTVLGRADSLDFCEALAHACRQAHAYPFVQVSSDASLLSQLSDPTISDANLATASPQLLAALAASNVVITTFFEHADPLAFNRIPATRLYAQRASEEAPSEIIFDHTRRWIGTEIPTPQQAAALGCDWPTFEKLFWQAMAVDYRPIASQAAQLAQKLSGADWVRVRASNGTDLRLQVGGRPLEQDVGVVALPSEQGKPYLNLPSGEVCFAPIENSAQGLVVIEQAFWQGQPIRNLQLQFEAGRVQALAADQGLELFKMVVANGGGDAALLGELGIGLNPAIDRVTGCTLLDEKMIGTAHIALGENRAFGGLNNSALHWDLVIQGAHLDYL